MTNDILKDGITGFFAIGQAPPETVSKKQILADCHLVARTFGWSVGTTNWATMSRNFHAVELCAGSKSIWVLFNQHHPLCAFSRLSAIEPGQHKFLDQEALFETFGELTSFRPLAISDLQRRVTAEDLKALNRAELEQVNYWKPSQIGDVIFNNWD